MLLLMILEKYKNKKSKKTFKIFKKMLWYRERSKNIEKRSKQLKKSFDFFNNCDIILKVYKDIVSLRDNFQGGVKE